MTDREIREVKNILKDAKEMTDWAMDRGWDPKKFVLAAVFAISKARIETNGATVDEVVELVRSSDAAMAKWRHEMHMRLH